MSATRGRRRIDKILDPSYAQNLESLSAADLRQALKECEGVELELSLQRRTIHGKLAILEDELRRRGEGGPVESDVLGRLAAILSEQPSASPRRGSRPRLAPATLAAARRSLDKLLGEAHLTRLPDLSTDEITAIVDRLAEQESVVSTQRRAVLAVVDRLQADLVKRYKEGRASASDVLREAANPKRG